MAPSSKRWLYEQWRKLSENVKGIWIPSPHLTIITLEFKRQYLKPWTSYIGSNITLKQYTTLSHKSQSLTPYEWKHQILWLLMYSAVGLCFLRKNGTSLREIKYDVWIWPNINFIPLNEESEHIIYFLWGKRSNDPRIVPILESSLYHSAVPNTSLCMCLK